MKQPEKRKPNRQTVGPRSQVQMTRTEMEADLKKAVENTARIPAAPGEDRK